MSTSTTSQESPETLVQVKAPFDHKQADIILRTSDGVDFRVFKIILSLASPIFTDMFDIPQPTSEFGRNNDELQVVTVSENSTVLDLCLRHLYPVPSPTTAGLWGAHILAEFARKYEVDALESVVARYLTDSIGDDSVGVYAIAVTYGLKSIAAKAARLSLKLPITRLRSPQLRCITAEPYGELIQYHATCGDAASAVASKREWFPAASLDSGSPRGRFIWFSNYNNPSNAGCSSCATPDPVGGTSVQMMSCSRGIKTKRFAPWCLWNYLHRSASVLAHHPTAEAVTTQDFIFKFFDCSNCSSETREDMVGFSRIFATEIEKAVEQVSVSIWLQSHVGSGP
jgi:BTB/POZ domain